MQALPKTPEAPETMTFMADLILLEKEGSGRVMVEGELAQAAEPLQDRSPPWLPFHRTDLARSSAQGRQRSCIEDIVAGWFRKACPLTSYVG